MHGQSTGQSERANLPCASSLKPKRTCPVQTLLRFGYNADVMKIQFNFDSASALSEFVENRKGMLGALRAMLQFGMTQSDIKETLSRARRNWGEVSGLMPELWTKADAIEARTTAKAKDMKPQDWAAYMAETKALANTWLDSVLTFLDGLTFEQYQAAPKQTRAGRVKQALNVKVGEAEYNAQTIFTVPEFLFAIADKDKLSAFYAEHSIPADFQIEVWNVLKSSAERVKTRTKPTVESVTAELAKEGLSDKKREALTAKLAKLQAKQTEAKTVEPQPDAS